MYVKVTDDKPSLITLNEFRKSVPNVSFPLVIPEETLAEHNIYPCSTEEPPQVLSLGQYISGTKIVKKEDGSWAEVFEVIDPTEEELSDLVRAERNNRLAATDFQMMPDVELDEQTLQSVKQYRQHLRDVPNQSGFPYSIDWFGTSPTQ